MRDVKRLWIREERRGPTLPRESLELVAGEGVVGDHAHGTKRHVTILFEDDWAAAGADLGRPVDPSARRANVLVSGGGGRELVGRRVRLGGAELELRGIVEPCGRMDEAAHGLRAALKPDGRGGVWGVVLVGGSVSHGDALAPLEDSAEGAGATDSQS